MSEPLTAERFEQFVDAYTTNHGDVVKRLDTIETRLAQLADVDALRATVANLESRVSTLESIRSR